MGRHSAGDPGAPGRHSGSRESPELGPVTDPVLLDQVERELLRIRSTPDPAPARSGSTRDTDELDDDRAEAPVAWAPPRPATGRVPVVPPLLPPGGTGGAAPRPAARAVAVDAPRTGAVPAVPLQADAPVPSSEPPRGDASGRAVQAAPAETPTALPPTVSGGSRRVGLSVPTLGLVAGIGLAVGALLSVLAYLRY